MACFLVSAAGAAAAHAASKAAEKSEFSARREESVKGEAAVKYERIPFSRKLRWLSSMLLGGSALLFFEHVWHGEITAWFPFLTAMGDPADTQEMLHEMGTVGVAMALLITAVWFGMVLITNAMEKRALEASETAELNA